ncbi:MAG TPA: TIM barrel protein, partial [Chitinophagaceae bacterium]|nr:TIM barrel protein [Chitinophagaceae bacterium]
MLLPYLTTQAYNDAHLAAHQREFRFLSESLQEKQVDVERLLEKLAGFQVAIPSWALGTGGTRFGRFPAGGEPRNLEEKMHDVALLDRIARCCGSISLHIPWDIPSDSKAIRSLANDLELRFDAVNSNTFQDQPGQALSYRYGSLSHVDGAVRKQAIEHNLEVVRYGADLGTDVLSLWLSDGSNFPGQNNISGALERTQDSLAAIYKEMPGEFRMFIEYKPFEPNFYATVIPDWGTAYLLAERTGDRASVLVDLGHHLPNTNIEQIVATVLSTGKLGGFHFNDSKYADDDLTTGSIRPYQLFLIFHELVSGLNKKKLPLSSLGWMIDASHNIKDPLEDLLQALEAIQLALLQALIVDTDALNAAQVSNDPAG